MRYSNFWCISFVSSEFFKHAQKTPKSCLTTIFHQKPEKKNTFTGLKTPQNCLFSSHLFFRQSWTKVLGHFCISGAFSNSHRSNPSPHPTNNVGRMYPDFFRISLYRIGGGRTARKSREGCTVLRGNREMTEKYEFCSTVPRSFVQDCRWDKNSADFKDKPVCKQYIVFNWSSKFLDENFIFSS